MKNYHYTFTKLLYPALRLMPSVILVKLLLTYLVAIYLKIKHTTFTLLIPLSATSLIPKLKFCPSLPLSIPHVNCKISKFDVTPYNNRIELVPCSESIPDCTYYMMMMNYFCGMVD